jgi:hypothetical protein
VHLQHRLPQRQQAALGAQLLRQRVGHFLPAGRLQGVEQGADGLLDLPGRELLAGGVEGQQFVRPFVRGFALALAAQRLVLGMGQLAAVVEDRDLAREQPLAARQQLLLRAERPAPEEHQRQPAAAVGDHHFQPLAPAAAEQGRLLHPGDHRDVLVDLQVGEPGQLAALGVLARVVVQQVARGVQAEVLGHHFRGGAADRLLQGFIQQGHVVHCTPSGRQSAGNRWSAGPRAPYDGRTRLSFRDHRARRDRPTRAAQPGPPPAQRR